MLTCHLFLFSFRKEFLGFSYLAIDVIQNETGAISYFKVSSCLKICLKTVSKLSQGCLKVTNAVRKGILKLSHIDMGYGKGGYGGWPGILRLKLSNRTVCLYISNVVIEDWCELKN